LTSADELDTDEVEEVVEKYMRLRLRDCLLKQGFQSKMKSGNGHVYLKALREQVMKELKLDNSAHLHDISMIETSKNWQFDIESPQNLLHLNNTDAMGYENLL